MDIMMPPLKQQPSPAPWLRRRERIDLPRLIEAALSLKPDASIDDVVAQLGSWGVQVSGIVVGMWMSDRDRSLLNTSDAPPMLLVNRSHDPRRRYQEQMLQWGSAT